MFSLPVRGSGRAWDTKRGANEALRLGVNCSGVQSTRMLEITIYEAVQGALELRPPTRRHVVADTQYLDLEVSDLVAVHSE